MVTWGSASACGLYSCPFSGIILIMPVTINGVKKLNRGLKKRKTFVINKQKIVNNRQAWNYKITSKEEHQKENQVQ